MITRHIDKHYTLTSIVRIGFGLVAWSVTDAATNEPMGDGVCFGWRRAAKAAERARAS